MSLIQYGIIMITTVLLSFQVFFTNISIMRFSELNIYEKIESSILNGNYLEIENDHNILDLGYIKNWYNMEVYIPKILLPSTQTISDGDTIFSNLDISHKNQIIKNGENNIDLGDDKLFLGYLYLYCIDTDNSGTCDNGENWNIR